MSEEDTNEEQTEDNEWTSIWKSITENRVLYKFNSIIGSNTY